MCCLNFLLKNTIQQNWINLFCESEVEDKKKKLIAYSWIVEWAGSYGLGYEPSLILTEYLLELESMQKNIIFCVLISHRCTICPQWLFLKLILQYNLSNKKVKKFKPKKPIKNL